MVLICDSRIVGIPQSEDDLLNRGQLVVAIKVAGGTVEYALSAGKRSTVVEGLHGRQRGTYWHQGLQQQEEEWNQVHCGVTDCQ